MNICTKPRSKARKKSRDLSLVLKQGVHDIVTYECRENSAFGMLQTSEMHYKNMSTHGVYKPVFQGAFAAL